MVVYIFPQTNNVFFPKNDLLYSIIFFKSKFRFFLFTMKLIIS